LKTTPSGQGVVFLGGAFDRFAGYTGEYGLVAEYLFVITVFSIILIIKNNIPLHRKVIGVIVSWISISIAISTGTRTFLVIYFLFILIFLTILFRIKKIRLRNFAIIIIVLFITIVTFISALKGTLLMERFQETEDIGGEKIVYGDQIDNLLNRPYFEEFENVMEVGNIFGVGPLNIVGVRNNAMCWHSLYYDLIIKFGVFGLMVYLIFYTRLLKDLYNKIINKSGENYYLLAALFVLLVALLLGQYARSYQNQTSFMLMYWLLFAVIAVVNQLPDSQEEKAITNT
jgi:O-antigen ligase